jgi:hypothetical protein
MSEDGRGTVGVAAQPGVVGWSDLVDMVALVSGEVIGRCGR